MNITASMNLPQELPVWPGDRVPSRTVEDGELPRFTYYLPSTEYRTGQSILILPGGGYGRVSTPKEGHRPAQLLAAHGIAAGVLEYRHEPSRYPVPLLDAQRGMRILRREAERNGLRTDRVGVMGFSAGGHLAGMVATHSEIAAGKVGDSTDGYSCAADFAVLVYPVVTLNRGSAHTGSRDNLLGENPDPEMVRKLSVEEAVTAATPPMLLIHGQADDAVPVENSILLYQALTAHGVSATMHLFEGEEHGFGLAANHSWGHRLLEWLERRAQD